MEKTSKFSFYAILAIVFFGFLGLSMPYLLFPSLFLDPSYSIVPNSLEGYRTVILGITLAAYPFGQFLGSPILGSLSDDYGRRKILAFSLAVTAISSFFSAYALLSSNLLLLVFSRFTAGIMEGNVSIARAYIADMKELNKSEAFGKMNACASIGYLIGPALGVILSNPSIHQSFSISVPFFLIAFLYLALSFSAYFFLKDRRILLGRSKITLSERLNIYKKIQFFFRDKRTGPILLISTIHIFAIDIFFEFGPVFLTTQKLMSPGSLAFHNSIACIALAITSGFICHRLIERFHPFLVIRTCLIAFIAALMAFLVNPYFWGLIILNIIFGFTISMINTTLTVLLSNSAGDDIQGEVLGVKTSLRVLGDAIVCLVGGILLTFSPYILILLSAFISVFTIRLLSRHRYALVS